MMIAFHRALETLKASLDEVRSTVASRSAQIDGIAAVAPIVMRHLEGLTYEKEKFQAALQSRRTTPDSFHRGLFVVSVSSFEAFVKMFVSALVQTKSERANKFSDLSDAFQNEYIVRASHVLAYVNSGSVRGIPYNFSVLRRELGACLADNIRPPLDGDVFTILMGNPTWDRLEKILESLEIGNPFDQSFGSSKSIRDWGKTSWKRNISEAKAKFGELIDRRNLIVHAAQPVTVVEQDIVEACTLFEAIASALITEMPDRI